MQKLQKFVEVDSSKATTGRVAYTFSQTSLPPPDIGMDWHKVGSFKAADEVLKDRRLKSVFKIAIAEGYAIVEPDHLQIAMQRSSSRGLHKSE